MTQLQQPLSGGTTRQYICPETVSGVLNTNPAFEQLVITGGSPNLTRDTLQDATLNGSRELTGVYAGSKSVSGEYAGNLTVGTSQRMIESALQTTKVAGISISSVDVTVDATLKTYTRATGDFVADGVEVGNLIRFAGMSGFNSRSAKVTAVNALVVTVGEVVKTLTNETLTVDYKIGAKYEVGSECKSFSILTWFGGRCGTQDRYLLSTGVEFTGFTFQSDINSMMTFSFPFLGLNQEVLEALPAGATYADAVNERKFDGQAGFLSVDGVVAPYTAFTSTLDGQASQQYEINDQDGASFIEYGQISNSVSMSAYLRDLILHGKFTSNTAVLATSIQECEKGAMSFTYKTLFLSESGIDISSALSIPQSISGTAVGDANNSSIIIQEIEY